MNQTLGLLTVLPPLVAVGLAIWKKQLLPSIFLGILVGEMILARGDIFATVANSLDVTLVVFSDKTNMQIVLFSLLAGSLLRLTKESGGSAGFMNWFEGKKMLRRRSAVYPLTFLLNISLFIDSWSSILITGSVMRTVYSKYRISRERLGYFLHTTALNFVALATLNSWGAYYMSLLRSQNVESPLKIILASIPLNFYCLGSLILVMIVMKTELTIGPLRKAEASARQAEAPRPAMTPAETPARGKTVKPDAQNLVLPILCLVILVFAGLYITGKGNLMAGSGATALFNAVCITIFLTSAFYLAKRIFRFEEMIEVIFKGMSDLLPIGILLILAMALGEVCKQLGTGLYLANIVKHNIPGFVVPAIIFALSCVISFATGTSYGTFAIMVPIAMPMAGLMGIDPALMFGACIGGGVFGDNCSPISDTSILTGMAAEVGVVDHVKTQIPYALTAASAAFILYIIFGLLRRA